VVFLDWFSTGYAESQPVEIVKYFDAIVYAFSSANTRIVFLMLPRLGWPRSYYDHYTQVVKQRYGLSVLDLTVQIPNTNWDLLLRDKIHTNDAGSLEYARIVANFLDANQFGQLLPIPTQKQLPTYLNKYYGIQSLDFADEKVKSIVISGNCEIIAMAHVVGPHSHALNFSRGNDTYQMNIWDRWCYYKRLTVTNFERAVLPDQKVEISVNLEPSIDKTIAKVQCDWEKEPKFVILQNIYYVGHKPDVSLCLAT
jgi:hypothetical protein